ncbi:hypothetical protein MLD38_034261 [Melastoma candidum]|uniref:Uncharacterized protein n=1 Tax=Melastoma candidum TaxID=119954 RepID=A0ACB9MB80_9MYRT|nr:hypothetical protein MLD38_034261 [Melastoma candidum]
MDSPQSVVSALRNSPVIVEKPRTDFFVLNSQVIDTGGRDKAGSGGDMEGPVGCLGVYIHQARDIHNICIYHKQDVYAKLCLTSDPDNAVSTKIVNGGGRNPVFNEGLRLKVGNLECSLKCEIWMLSRVRNYLEDQLLGVALVPLSDVLLKNGKLEKEFSLSSTDLFHSPAGFVQLSISYAGTSPEVLFVPAPVPVSLATDTPIEESEEADQVPRELERIEFPDPKIVNENQIMVSEYFGLPCNGLDSNTDEKLDAPDNETPLNSEIGVQVVECLAAAANVLQQHALDSPQSTTSSSVVTSPSVQASSQSSEALVVSRGQEQSSELPAGGPISSTKNLVEDHGSDNSSKPVVSIKVPEQKVVQQDIVDMYMKSMQQFTESLAKMKLPLDIETDTASLGEQSPDQGPDSSRNSGSRVFYGSRAFF